MHQLYRKLLQIGFTSNFIQQGGNGFHRIVIYSTIVNVLERL
jgi:hypothetical protein